MYLSFLYLYFLESVLQPVLWILLKFVLSFVPRISVIWEIPGCQIGRQYKYSIAKMHKKETNLATLFHPQWRLVILINANVNLLIHTFFII